MRLPRPSTPALVLFFLALPVLTILCLVAISARLPPTCSVCLGHGTITRYGEVLHDESRRVQYYYPRREIVCPACRGSSDASR